MTNWAKLGYDDAMRAEKALLGAVGKRLTYRTTGGQLEASKGRESGSA